MAKKEDQVEDKEVEEKDEKYLPEGGESEVPAGESEAASPGGEASSADDEDAPLTDDEREILRQHRRQERKETKARKREAIARKDRYISQLETQVRELAGRVESVETRATGQDVARLDAAIEAAAQEAELAKTARSEAKKVQDVEVEEEADEALYSARRKLEELSLLKRRVMDGQRNEAARRTTGTPAAPSPLVVERATEWANGHQWFNRRGSDEDSEIVRVVDKGLTREGWDPTTQEYWEELDERLKNRLPHRYNGKSPVKRQITGGGSGESTGVEGGFRMSAERINALKEAGMWDDPKARARMIKRYQDADKQAR